MADQKEIGEIAHRIQLGLEPSPREEDWREYAESQKSPNLLTRIMGRERWLRGLDEQGEPASVSGMLRNLLFHAGKKKSEVERQRGRDFSNAQSKRASKLRGQRGNPVIAKAILTLARRREWPAKELWTEFLGCLDAAHLDPIENAQGDDENKWSVSYLEGRKRSSMTFGRFKNRISTARKNHA